MSENQVNKIVEIINDLSECIEVCFNLSLERSFLVSSMILSQDKLPYFNNLDEDENAEIEGYYNSLKELEYKPSEMRRAFQKSYLFSLRDKDKVEVKTTPELPLIYLKMITETLVKSLNYERIRVLNASGNIGTLASSIAISDFIKEEDLYETVENENDLNLSLSLSKLCGFTYPIQNSLPSPEFRCDIIVSDPFLRSVEDILIFFEDYSEYLNLDGFFVSVLRTDFIRSRIFSDMVEKHGYVLIGLIEYPKDLLDGLIQSSIVILEKKKELNKEFFSAEMPSVKEVENNINTMNEVKNYIINYLEKQENENHVN